MIDIVIPLGRGSRWQDNELRYCLRSIEKHLTGYRNIWIVGYLPKWVTGVKHIPATDETKNSDYNIMRKIELSCLAGEISDSFLFMNDDHYLLSDFDAPTFPYYYSGTLEEMYKLRGSSPYGKKCRNTYNLLNSLSKSTKYFDVHTPIIYKKNEFLDSVAYQDWGMRQDTGFVIKSLYANSASIEGVEIQDCKSPNLPLYSWKTYSTTPQVVEGVKNFLQRYFPDKSKYEI